MRSAFLAVMLLGLVGCGGDATAPNLSATLPVRGTVAYKGKPMTGGTIKFEPEDTGREAHSAIGPDGTFVLSTFKEGDGAIAGLHRVAVTGASAAGAVPLKYKSPSSSKVEVEVVAGKTDYVLNLD